MWYSYAANQNNQPNINQWPSFISMWIVSASVMLSLQSGSWQLAAKKYLEMCIFISQRCNTNKKDVEKPWFVELFQWLSIKMWLSWSNGQWLINQLIWLVDSQFDYPLIKLSSLFWLPCSTFVDFSFRLSFRRNSLRIQLNTLLIERGLP